MPNILEGIYKGGQTFIEEYLTVDEQVKGMMQRRNLTGEEKIYLLMNGKGPYKEQRNFGESMLAYSKNTKFDSDRE